MSYNAVEVIATKRDGRELSNDAIAPAAFYDAARAVQFIRQQAKEWGIDPTRIAPARLFRAAFRDRLLTLLGDNAVLAIPTTPYPAPPQDHRVLAEIAELTDIPRPRVGLQRAKRAGLDRRAAPVR